MGGRCSPCAQSLCSAQSLASLLPSFPPSLPASLPPSLPASLPPFPPSLLPSLPPSSLPPSLPPSFPPSLSPSFLVLSPCAQPSPWLPSILSPLLLPSFLSLIMACRSSVSTQPLSRRSTASSPSVPCHPPWVRHRVLRGPRPGPPVARLRSQPSPGPFLLRPRRPAAPHVLARCQHGCAWGTGRAGAHLARSRGNSWRQGSPPGRRGVPSCQQVLDGVCG